MPSMTICSIEMKACIDACYDACRICAPAATRCAEANQSILWRVLADCAAICESTAGCIARGSECCPTVCACCVAVCERCAQACRQSGDRHLLECAAACDRCALACAIVSRTTITTR